MRQSNVMLQCWWWSYIEKTNSRLKNVRSWLMSIDNISLSM
ncbi:MULTISPECIES: hypothetical protein [unclassified Fusobacterium]|nr:MULTISPECIES: hypothetical protein [unclassified Fusobacterium]